MQYRRDIDGLRAVAVIPVIFFHAGFGFASGGFVGVDVFFVISGYLITTIIQREVDENRFSFVEFYERRARRILPALFFMLMVVTPFCWLWMLPGELEGYSRSLAATISFAANFHFWLSSDYFGRATELMPLLHTWSLAVEEQFYIFFPILLLVLRRISARQLFAVLFCISLVSLMVAEWASRAHPSAAFYLLPTRAWELGFGAMAAIAVPLWQTQKLPGAGIIASTGLAMIITSMVFFNALTPFPGVFALLPALGTTLIICFSHGRSLSYRLLSPAPVVFVGLISYSAYLWHQPLFALARVRLFGDVSDLIYLLLIGVTLIMAWLSWRLVERPFRKRQQIGRAQIFSATAAVSVILVGFGAFGAMNKGLPERLPDQAKQLVASIEDRAERRVECFGGNNQLIDPAEACILNQTQPQEIALWGDSHAFELSQELGSAMNEQNRAVRILAHSLCPPIVGIDQSARFDGCTKFNEAVRTYLLANDDIKTVVMLARWSLYFEGTRFDNGKGGHEFGSDAYVLPVGMSLRDLGAEDRVSAVGELLRVTVRDLLAAGKQVVLVDSVPEMGWNVPEHLAREMFYGVDRDRPLTTSYARFKSRNAAAERQIAPLRQNSSDALLFVRTEDIFCDKAQDYCAAELNGVPLYFDDDHLSSLGNKKLATKIVTQLQSASSL